MMFPKIHQKAMAHNKGSPIGTISLMSDSQANIPLEDPMIKQIRRLELEYLRLNKRFMQIQDAGYIVGL